MRTRVSRSLDCPMDIRRMSARRNAHQHVISHQLAFFGIQISLFLIIFSTFYWRPESHLAASNNPLYHFYGYAKGWQTLGGIQYPKPAAGSSAKI